MKTLRFLGKSFCAVLILALVIPVGYFPLEESDAGLEGVKINEDFKKGTIGAYVINLDRSPDRLSQIVPQVEKLGVPYHRFSAVDGALLSDEKIEKTVDFDRHYSLINNYPKKGTIGCTLSHTGVWREFLESDYEYALVLEDDIVLNTSNMALVLEDLKKERQVWDLVNFSPMYEGTPLIVKPLEDGLCLSVYLSETAGAAAYLINRKAAVSMLKKAFPMCMSIDHMYTRSWEFGLNYLGVENPRVAVHGDGESNIGQTSQAKIEESSRVFDRIHRGLFKLQTYVMITVTALKVYISNL